MNTRADSKFDWAVSRRYLVLLPRPFIQCVYRFPYNPLGLVGSGTDTSQYPYKQTLLLCTCCIAVLLTLFLRHATSIMYGHARWTRIVVHVVGAPSPSECLGTRLILPLLPGLGASVSRFIEVSVDS